MAFNNVYQASLVTADTLVKTGGGILHSLTFTCNDAAPTAGSVDIYDGTSSSGTKIYSETFTTTPFRASSTLLDIAFGTGLYVDFTTTADVNLTIAYR